MTSVHSTDATEEPGAGGRSGTYAEVVDLLSTLIRFDTTNWGRGTSAGEREAAVWVAGRLESVGWAPRLLARDDAPSRANVVLRVPGVRRDRPGLLVHAHLDVVPAEADDWSVDPFGGLVSDGYVWGRGAVDLKDMCAMTLATLLRWGRGASGRSATSSSRSSPTRRTRAHTGRGGWPRPTPSCSTGSRRRSARAAGCSAGSSAATRASAATPSRRPSAG